MPASASGPFLQVPSLARLGECQGIEVVSVDNLAVTIEIRGPAAFLRRAESRLMREVNVALLDGKPVLLQRASWTQLDQARLRACLSISDLSR